MSEGMAPRLKGLGDEEPRENVLDDSLMVHSCIEMALMRRLPPRLNRLDTTDETEDLDRTEGVLRDLG